jgi:hypothetical protein
MQPELANAALFERRQPASRGLSWPFNALEDRLTSGPEPLPLWVPASFVRVRTEWRMTMTTTTQKTNGLAEATSALASALTAMKGGKKKGPKEQQLAQMRSTAAMPTDGSIPAFLDRTKGMSKAEIAASAEQARENAERCGASSKRGLTSAAPKASNLTEADKKAIAELTKAKADEKAEKKAAENERLGKLAAAKKAEKAEIKAVKDAAKAANPPATPAKKGKAEKQPAPKRKSGDRARYDWNGAREDAAKGTIPAAPDFSANTHRCYRPLLAEVEKLVKAKNLAGLQAYKIKGSCTSPAAVKRYREIALIALKARKA